MNVPPNPGFLSDEGPVPAAAPDRARARIEPWRLGVATLIVAVVVAAIWLWGRPEREQSEAMVAVTSQAWLAGQPTGAFELVSVPSELGDQFARPEVVAASIAAYDIPEGSFVTPALLAEPDSTAGELTTIRFEAVTSAWPAPGPRAGAVAVVSAVLGGCALDVATLAGGDEGEIVVRVDHFDAARLAEAASLGGLVVWPAPPDGWPLCPQHRPAASATPGWLDDLGQSLGESASQQPGSVASGSELLGSAGPSSAGVIPAGAGV